MDAKLYHPPRFTKPEADLLLFKELKRRVYQQLSALPTSRLQYVRLKAFLLPLLYIGIYTAALYTTRYMYFCMLYALLGLLIVPIFLNLIHEACHHTLFKSKKANQYYLLLFDLLGSNSYIWQRRHVRMHHNYPNVIGWDADIEKCDYLKIHPADHRKQAIRHQHYLVLLYPLFVTNWFLIRDFRDFLDHRTPVRQLGTPPVREYLKLFAGKSIFIGYMVVVPTLILPFAWWQVVITFFLLLLCAGGFALTVLIPPHVNMGNHFYKPDITLTIDHSWLMHQLTTTNDVQGDNWFMRHVLANGQCHLAHHLFPDISYAYAPELTGVIRDFCVENGLPYKAYKLVDTFKKHYQLIRRNEQPYDIFSEDM